MDIEEYMQSVVEQLRQLLACHAISFEPACFDTGLRHPLLQLMPRCCSSGKRIEQARVTALWQTEEVQELADLAQQRGRLQILDVDESFTTRWGFRSLAAFPLELVQGTLGVFLLLDERVEQFGPGELRLLYACVPIHVPELEQALWEQACTAIQAGLDQKNQASSGQVEPEQFIRSEFVSMVGHELRAPLSVIKGYAGLLQAYGGSDEQGGLLAQEHLLKPAQQRHYLDVIMQQTSILELLVADLLDISRLQRGQLALQPHALDIGELCQQAVVLGQMRAEQVGRGKYHLECKLAKNLPAVRADATRLQQVLLNLLENAIKYSPQGGQIILEAVASARGANRQPLVDEQDTGTQVAITIRDQGIGMPQQQIGRLFQPFERAELPATARIPGMGLGLYIARKLVEAMDGTIDLQSCEGRGTNVTICLPTVHQSIRSASGEGVQASSLRIG